LLRASPAHRSTCAVPGDYSAWAALGSAYVESARITADPTYYPKAEGALRRSLELRPTGNPAALTGLGALANARHEFAAARNLAHRVLRVDPYSADAYGVLADAQTQLGDHRAATEAIQHMLDLRPGLAAYARASYDLEQHGRLGDAAALMRRALTDAVDPPDIAGWPPCLRRRGCCWSACAIAGLPVHPGRWPGSRRSRRPAPPRWSCASASV
jgi:tetratricopeptide (TPR) repeat protein